MDQFLIVLMRKEFILFLLFVFLKLNYFILDGS